MEDVANGISSKASIKLAGQEGHSGQVRGMSCSRIELCLEDIGQFTRSCELSYRCWLKHGRSIYQHHAKICTGQRQTFVHSCQQHKSARVLARASLTARTQRGPIQLLASTFSKLFSLWNVQPVSMCQALSHKHLNKDEYFLCLLCHIAGNGQS